MVKTLDPVIKEAFKKFGFSEDEVKDGCWLLERENKKTGETIKVAWIALHKFLEKVAQRMDIVFDEPKVMNCTDGEVAIYVRGTVLNEIGSKLNQAWSIGEASAKNCTNQYRWAMAEKRAKDRVILKLLGVAGDMYSEEEADEFKPKEKTPAQKASETRAKNKATKEEVEAGARKAIEYISTKPDNSIEIYSDDYNKLEKMENLLREWNSDLLNGFLEAKRAKIKPDEIPFDEIRIQ